jgi:hypothetical protein
LGLTPAELFSRDEPMSARNPASRVRDEGLWLLDSELDSSEPIDRHLLVLLERLEPRIDELGALAADASFDFFVGFASESGQGGVVIGSELLARLTRIQRASLTLDLYPPEEPAEEPAPGHTPLRPTSAPDL